MDHLNVFIGVLSLLVTASISFTGIAYKIFSDAIKKLENALHEQRLINDRIETRINANQVSIAKFESVVKALEKIEIKLDEMQKIILRTIKNGSS